MPVVPGATYPTAEDVMNLARAIINDMQVSTAGATLTDNKPFTVEYLNMAIGDCQQYLALNGVTSNLVDDFILTPITPVANQDPSIQCYISTDGYFDGSVINATPVLPPDNIVVLRCWERVTDSGAWFTDMTQPQDGLQSHLPGPYVQKWEWRQDRINFVGSTSTEDIRIRYEGSLANLAPNSTTNPFSNTTIRIKDGKRAMAYLVASYYGDARGSAQAPTMLQRAQDQMDAIINRYTRRDQRIGYRRGAYGHSPIDGGLSGTYR